MLRRQISGDLDAIVYKATQHKRENRYQSALELAADLSRYLQRAAVLARPADTIAPLPALRHRHKTLMSVCASCFAILVVALVITISSLRECGESNAKVTLSAYVAQVSAAHLASQAGNLSAARGSLRELDKSYPSDSN